MGVNVFGIRFEPDEMPSIERELIEGIFDTQNPAELTVTLLASGIPALFASFVLALLVGSRWTRQAALLGLGVIPFALVFAQHLLSHDPMDCHDCYSAFGGAYHPLELFATQVNIVGWIAGVAAGATLRSVGTKRRTRRFRPQIAR